MAAGKNSMLAFMGAVVAQTKAHRLAMLAILAALLVQVGYNLGLPITYKFIFDNAILNKDEVLLADLLVLLLAIFVANGVAGVVQDILAARVGNRLVADLRERLFTTLQGQSASFFHATPEGEISTAFGSDMAAVETAVIRAMPSVVMRAFTISLSTAALFFIEWRLALATFLILPITFLAPKPFGQRARDAGKTRDQGQSEALGFVQESVAVHTVVRAFRLQDVRLGDLRRMLAEVMAAGVRATVFTSLVGRSANLAVGAVQLVVLGLGAWLAVNDYMTSGLLIAFIGLLLNIGGATNQLTEALPLLMGGAASLGRIQDMLDRQPDVTEAAEAKQLPRLTQRISFEDIVFGYDGEHRVLDGVSATIAAGQQVAFVGSSGSGKSTMLSLLMRLYDPQAGRVCIDDADIATGTDASLRDQIGVVLQNTALFRASIRENIRLGRPGATDAEVEAAARMAEMHDVILRLPQGYDTDVGSGGGSLSGGQRQRIAIARALIRNPAILLLDEATSALDPSTEAQVNATIERLAAGKTVVSVTHRLASVVNLDEVFVMDQGRLVESGRHEDLLAQNGFYAELWRKQSGFSIDEAGASAKVSPERLRHLSFLAGASDTLLDRLSAMLVSEHFPAGRTVFEQNDPGDKFYLVARGRLSAFLPATTSTPERSLRVMEDGDFFGEIALVRATPRTASVRAVTESLCLSLQRQQFLSLLEEEPEIKDRIVAAIDVRLAHSGQVAAEEAVAAG